MTPKKSRQMVGALPKLTKLTIEYPQGAASVESLEHAEEVLEALETTKAQIEPVIQTLEMMRRAVTDWAKQTKTDVIQLDGRYWRKVQRMSRRWITVPAEMPAKKPKGAKSLKEICTGKTTPKGTPLFNALTTRVADSSKIDSAVQQGWITEKEIQRAYIETPQAEYLQRYEGDDRG